MQSFPRGSSCAHRAIGPPLEHLPSIDPEETQRSQALVETRGVPLGDRPGSAAQRDPVERAISRQVRTVLAAMYPLTVNKARRCEERFPYPRLIELHPSTPEGDLLERPVAVVGKHLSEHGLGFFHLGPLPHRWVVVELELVNGLRYSFLMQLLWCRFIREGWYESGGRFVRQIERPANVA